MTKTSTWPARDNCRVKEQGDAAKPTIGARIGGRRQDRPAARSAQARPRPGQIPRTFLRTESEAAARLDSRRGLGAGGLTTRGSCRRLLLSWGKATTEEEGEGGGMKLERSERSKGIGKGWVVEWGTPPSRPSCQGSNPGRSGQRRHQSPPPPPGWLLFGVAARMVAKGEMEKVYHYFYLYKFLFGTKSGSSKSDKFEQKYIGIDRQMVI
jgi:hypothetical protein